MDIHRTIPNNPGKLSRHGRAFANFCRRQGDTVVTRKYKVNGNYYMDVGVAKNGET